MGLVCNARPPLLSPRPQRSHVTSPVVSVDVECTPRLITPGVFHFLCATRSVILRARAPSSSPSISSPPSHSRCPPLTPLTLTNPHNG